MGKFNGICSIGRRLFKEEKYWRGRMLKRNYYYYRRIIMKGIL